MFPQQAAVLLEVFWPDGPAWQQWTIFLEPSEFQTSYGVFGGRHLVLPDVRTGKPPLPLPKQ